MFSMTEIRLTGLNAVRTLVLIQKSDERKV